MKIIIAGAYSIGTHLSKLLSRSKETITLVDDDDERLAKIGADFDLLTYEGSPSSLKVLRDVGADDADLFIAVTPDQSLNVNSCILARALGAKKTVAQIDNDEYTEPETVEFFNHLGVNSLVYPEQLAATDIINGLKMSWVRQRWDVHGGALVMLGIKMHAGSEILGQPLKDICGPDDPYHVVGIKRPTGDTVIPGGNDTLENGDMAYFMTTKPFIPYLRRLVGKEHYVDVKNVMVMGGGKTAVKAVNAMPSYMDVKVIEQNPARAEALNDLIDPDKAMVILGDGRDVQLLNEEGIRYTQAFVALTSNAETNILACLTAKRLGVRKTVAMVENLDYVNMAESLDIGTIINKKAIAAGHIYQLMFDADVFNVRSLLTANSDVAEFIAREGSKITEKAVKDLRLPPNITIGGLVRAGEGLLVSGNTRIQAGDSVMVFCQSQNLKKIEKLFL